MADLVTHLLVNQLLGQERLSGAALRWFVAGALLPDLASRVPRMVLKAAMGQGWVDSGPTSRAILFGLDVPHMPIGFALVCVAAAALAPVSWLPGGRRRRAGGWLLAGGGAHLLLDLLQEHITPAYAYLWPLSDARWELGWTSTEASLVAIPFLALAVWLRRPKARRAAPVTEDRPPAP